MTSDRKWSTVTADTPIQEYFPPLPAEPVKRDLTSLADYFKTDKGTIKHNYTQYYERYFVEHRDHIANLLEIGVGNGCSLKMWGAWAPFWQITGLDVRPECLELCKGRPNIRIYKGDATKTKIGANWDIIIDDGSHRPEDMAATLNLYWDSLNPGGFYCIEDFKPTYKSRPVLMDTVNNIMMNVDRRAIEYVHYYPELMIIKKSQ